MMRNNKPLLRVIDSHNYYGTNKVLRRDAGLELFLRKKEELLVRGMNIFFTIIPYSNQDQEKIGEIISKGNQLSKERTGEELFYGYYAQIIPEDHHFFKRISPEEFEKYLIGNKEKEAIGAKLNTGITGIRLTEEIRNEERRINHLLEPYFKIINKHHKILLVHSSREENKDTVDEFEMIKEKYSNIRLIIAHMGGLSEEKIRRAEKILEQDGVYLNTAGITKNERIVGYEQERGLLEYWNKKEEGLIKIIEEHIIRNNNRIIFGSDYPELSITEHIESINKIRGLNEEEKRKILYQNFEELITK